MYQLIKTLMQKEYYFRDNPNIFNYKTLKVKWVLDGIEDVVITEDLKVWKLPFESGLKHYKYRLLKPEYHQGQIKIRIKGKRYTREDILNRRIEKRFEIKTNIIER